MKKKNSQSNLLVKECLLTALLKLTKNKSLSSISISELCSVAGVSRMAYYRNYDSIDEIFIYHLIDLFEQYKYDYAKMMMAYIPTIGISNTILNIYMQIEHSSMD